MFLAVLAVVFEFPGAADQVINGPSRHRWLLSFAEGLMPRSHILILISLLRFERYILLALHILFAPDDPFILPLKRV